MANLHFVKNFETGEVTSRPFTAEEESAWAAKVLAHTPTLEQVKEMKVSELIAARKAACTANITVQGKTFSAATETQTDFKRLADRLRRGKATNLQAIFDAAGNPVAPITQALLDGIEDAIAANVEDAWNNYGAKVAAVNAATTVEQVDAVSW